MYTGEFKRPPHMSKERQAQKWSDILKFNLRLIPSEAVFSGFGILVNAHNKKW